MAVEVAGDKEETKYRLSKAKIPVPDGGVCCNKEQLAKLVNEIGYPLVVKPLSGNQGKGATIGVSSWEEASAAFDFAQKYGQHVMVESCISGYDFRILVINNKFAAAAKRIPAHVTGDGKSTVRQLVDQENLNPRRGEGHDNVLTKITIERDSEEILKKQKLTIDSIPHLNRVVMLKSTANLSTGGTAIDVTDDVHPDNIFLAERVAKIIGLDICGIDIMANNLHEPLEKNGGVVLEVNAAPGFRMHLSPSAGKPRNVAAAVVDMLYPSGSESRIPIIAVTGTNGKTTTSRMLSHMAKNSGYNVGFTTTDGIYINDHLIEKGDTTGPISAGFVLADPSVDFAVLETARGGILRSGLSYHQCDVGIITNIREDHLGLNDINTLEDLANVKGVVARSVKKNGWAVLNGEDEHCKKIGDELDCNVAYFSLDPENDFIQQQIAKGQPVAVYENGYVSIIKGTETLRIERVNKIPITFGGTAKFMIANTLAATLAGYLWGFTAEDVRHSLQTFVPSFEQTPGRLNHFKFRKFEVVVDYAHNPHGYTAIEDYLANVKANRKIGIISGIGDRRDEDIRECALIACRMFDHVIIRQEHDLRGRTEQGINALLLQGMIDSCKKVSYEIIPKETDAIQRALGLAGEGDLVVALSDEYASVIDVIKSELEKEESRGVIHNGIKPALPQINLNRNYHGKTA